MNILPLAMIAVLILGFWLMAIRPAKARQAAQRRAVEQITVGQRVMTTAGLFGIVCELTDTEVSLEIADGVVVRMVKAAIAQAADEVESLALGGLADVVDVAGEANVVDVTKSN